MKRFKKLLPIVMAAVMVAATMGGCASSNKGSDTKSGDTKSAKSSVLIGSAIYKFDDTFMTGVRTAMESQAKEKGSTTLTFYFLPEFKFRIVV